VPKTRSREKREDAVGQKTSKVTYPRQLNDYVPRDVPLNTYVEMTFLQYYSIVNKNNVFDKKKNAYN